MVIPLHCCLLAGLSEGLRCGELRYQVTLWFTGGERGGIPPSRRPHVCLSCIWSAAAPPITVLCWFYAQVAVWSDACLYLGLVLVVEGICASPPHDLLWWLGVRLKGQEG